MVNVDYVRLCQEIKDDGLLPETCHDHNNHTAAAISLTGSEWGKARQGSTKTRKILNIS